MTAPRFFLIDGSAYFFRAFYAVRGLSTSAGLPTNAVFGFTNMLLRVLKAESPDAVGVVFDAPGKTFREDLYPEYKANRDETPEELVRQLPYVKAVPPAFNVETLEVEGVEADDVIGTLARRGVEAGFDVVIVTGDKDFMQLVTRQADAPGPGIVLLDDMKGRTVGIDQVVEKFGVPPAGVIDVLALMGDSSDNIPGVKGVGPKGAGKLIAEYGTLENLYDHLDELKPAMRKKLEEGKASAFLSRDLATIRTKLDVEFEKDRFARREPDRARLEKLFTELEFTRLLRDLDVSVARREGLSRDGYRLILTRGELETAAAEMRHAKRLAVDVETTSTDPMSARLVGISLCTEPGKAVYVPVAHDYLGAPEQIPVDGAIAVLRPLLEDPNVPKVGQNIKYDALVLARHGAEVAPISFDTMVGAYLVNPDDGPFNLDALSRKWLQHDTIRYSDVCGTGRKQIPFSQVPVERARDYSGEDTDVTLRLAAPLEARIREDGLDGVLRDIEMPLIGILLELERNGVRIDLDHFATLSRDFEKRMGRLVKAAFEAAGEEFNLDSPKQLQRILFDKLELPKGRRTKTGFSTDMGVLEKLAPLHALPARILEYRGLAKLKNTYVDALPQLVNAETGRIHTSYNQAVAATGRLSSSDPNLQNIPVRTEEGRSIRAGFVPERGRVYIGADYSQVELRVMAHLSGDERLQEAFREDRDIHAATAEEIFGEGKGDARRRAKEINFGILYGMSAFGLSQRLGIDPKEAQEYIDLYFSRYPRVKGYLDTTLEEARRVGYVKTLFDRRRYVPDVASKNRMVSAGAERVAVNAPIQGTAADLMKLAMIRVSRALKGTGAWVILQVHDELVLEVEGKGADEAADIVRREMEGVHELSVPLKVDVARGSSWADLK